MLVTIVCLFALEVLVPLSVQSGLRSLEGVFKLIFKHSLKVVNITFALNFMCMYPLSLGSPFYIQFVLPALDKPCIEPLIAKTNKSQREFFFLVDFIDLLVFGQNFG